MKNLKQILFIVLFALLPFSVFGQFTLSYQISNYSKAGVGYDFTEKIGGEIRFYTNVLFDNFTPELMLKYNILNKESYDFYTGVGGVINLYDGIFVPVGFQFRPISNFPQFSIVAELEPLYDFSTENFFFLGGIGFRFKFKKKIEIKVSTE